MSSPVNIIQHCFNHGEFSPIMVSRSDIEMYHKAAKRLRNVIVLPQGAVRRRFATEYVTDLSLLVGTSGDRIMLTAFDYSPDTSYTIILTDNAITIYNGDTLKFTGASPYSGTDLSDRELRFAQGTDRVIITHPDYAPYELIRVSDTSWILQTITFKNLPTYDFNGTDYSGFTFTLSTAAVATGATLTSSSAIFSSDFVGGSFEGLGEDLSDELGFARITAYTDPTHVTVDIKAPFASNYTSGVKGTSVFLGEPLWNSTDGYPISCCFYEGRLVFGGTKAVPNIITMSASSDIYNFDKNRGYAADAIQVEIQSRVNIRHIIGDKSLQIFAATEEFGSMQIDGKILTPNNIPIRQQSRNGIENVSPQVLDNQTFYIKRGGKGVMNFIYNDTENAYKSKDVSVISSHLIVNPIDSAVYSGSRTEDANFLFLVNNDGTLAVYQTMYDEDVSAWSLADFGDDKVIRVESVGDEVYFIIKRTIDGNTMYYLERLALYDLSANDLYFMDSIIKVELAPADTTVTGLGHLEGRTVQAIADGYYVGEFTVASGEIELENNASTVWVGLGFTPLIETLPIDIQTNVYGQTGYEEKRIVTIGVDYYQSYGVYVDSQILIPFMEFDNTFNYDPPEGQTGYIEIPFLRDSAWEPRQTITISQVEPGPMTILALNYKVYF